MSRFYEAIVADPTNLDYVDAAFKWFDREHEDARADLKVRGLRLNDVAVAVAGQMEFRYGQWSELNAILSHLELHELKAKQAARRRYVEHYNRALTERQVERYAEADDEVLKYRAARIKIGLVKDRYEGLTKGLESLHFQVTNLTKMRTAMIDDATI